jgi:redox-sensitive bicupin YhaK (pirin superfamily)
MSNLDTHPAPTVCGGRGGTPGGPVRDVIPGREVLLGESTRVRRMLPTLGRRMVGAWCFLDHYGPDDIAGQDGMQVAPHPHIGLQTVTWLYEGEVLHRDSLGNEQLVRPGELGLMTSGRGISHSEESPPAHPALLHGMQLWVALPGGDRGDAPAYEHHPKLPVVTGSGASATVIMGELDGAASPGRAYSPLMGAEVSLREGADVRLPLEPDFEHAVVAASPGVEVDGVPLAVGSLMYLGTGRPDVRLRAETATGVLLLGGEPFEEEIVMWWNFVGRGGDEVAAARAAWQAEEERFGVVRGYHGDRLPAPELPPVPLRPRGRTR